MDAMKRLRERGLKRCPHCRTVQSAKRDRCRRCKMDFKTHERPKRLEFGTG